MVKWFIVILLFALSCKAQTKISKFHRYIEKGDSSYIKNNYYDAGINYSKALKYPQNFNTHEEAQEIDRVGMQALNCWVNIKSKEGLFDWMKFMLLKYKFNLEDLLVLKETISYIPDKSWFTKEKKWTKLNAELDEQINKAKLTLNKPLKRFLDSMFIKWENDDSHYLLKRKNGTVEGKVSKAEKSLEIGKILDKYGWPSSESVGSYANYELFLFFNDCDLKTREKYLSLMDSAVRSGAAEGSHIAEVIDGIFIDNGKKQIFGTRFKLRPDSSYEVLPIGDSINVNERRKKVGLYPIEESYSFFKINFLKEIPEEKTDRSWLIFLCPFLALLLLLIYKCLTRFWR